MKIPKFRNTTRLVKWVKKWHSGSRLPRDREQVFFTSKKESPELIAQNLADYSWNSTGLEAEFEKILVAHPPSVITYARRINQFNTRISEYLEDSLKGHTMQLYELACLYNQRVPTRLEDTIVDGSPYWALRYATEIIRGRLPLHLESVFFKDARIASQYAFQVIRGFASVRLPDDLHSFMIMKSFENPDDSHIKVYIEASESDPNKIGNSVRSV